MHHTSCSTQTCSYMKRAHNYIHQRPNALSARLILQSGWELCNINKKCVSHFTPTQRSNLPISASPLWFIRVKFNSDAVLKEAENFPEMIPPWNFSLSPCGAAQEFNLRRSDRVRESATESTFFTNSQTRRMFTGLTLRPAANTVIMDGTTLLSMFHTFVFFPSDGLRLNPRQRQEFKLAEAKL